jgi:small subunit ribosomal protein S1
MAWNGRPTLTFDMSSNPSDSAGDAPAPSDSAESSVAGESQAPADIRREGFGSRGIRIGSQRAPGQPMPAAPNAPTHRGGFRPRPQPDRKARQERPKQEPGDAPAAGDDTADPRQVDLREAAAAETERLKTKLEAISQAVEESDIPATPELPPATAAVTFPPPRRAELPSDLQHELDEALAGVELDDLITSSTGRARITELEPESRHKGVVTKIHEDDLFVDLGGRNLGLAPLHTFANPPAVGTQLEVVVRRFLPEEGLYEIFVPGAAVDIGDWSELSEGLVVEAVITGHNKGGLECEVSRLRGFIPISQVAQYRVEELEPFVGQKLLCVVTEANPQKRNLVLSRRAMIEREAAENRAKLLAELAPGQIREGMVRKLTDFGAFVDLGGVDGLVHVSQLSWDRISHPKDVLQEGQRIKVRVERMDPQTGKISLSYRDLFESPWASAERKYPATAIVDGVVSRIMDFGAFVKLEPGVEGLVHISELSHKRVFRVSDVVKEGQQVTVQVLSIDTEAQRIGLSLKALEARPEPAKKEDSAEPVEESPPAKPQVKRKTPLAGGLGKVSDEGAKFGLKW